MNEGGMYICNLPPKHLALSFKLKQIQSGRRAYVALIVKNAVEQGAKCP